MATQTRARPSWIEDYLETLTAVARRLAGDAVQAEDLVNSAIEDALRASRPPEPARRRAWLVRVLTNRFISECRRWSARNVVLMHEPAEIAAPPPDEPCPWDHVTTEMYQRAVDELHPKYGVPYRLKTGDGWSYRQIADHLGIEPGTVGSRIRRAREQLFEKLKRKP